MTPQEIKLLQTMEHWRNEAEESKRREKSSIFVIVGLSLGCLSLLLSGPAFDLPRSLREAWEGWRRPTPLVWPSPQSLLISSQGSGSITIGGSTPYYPISVSPLAGEGTGVTISGGSITSETFAKWDAMVVYDARKPADVGDGCYLSKLILSVKQDGTTIWGIDSSDAAAVESAAQACGPSGGVVRALAKK